MAKIAVLAVGATIPIALLLTACGQITVPLSRDPISIQRSADDGLVVAVCYDVEVTEIQGEVRTDADWSIFWDARGNTTVVRGAIVDESTLGDHLEVLVMDRPSLDASTEISIFLTAQDPNNSLAGLFALEHALDDSLWLHPNGTESAQPC